MLGTKTHYKSHQILFKTVIKYSMEKKREVSDTQNIM